MATVEWRLVTLGEMGQIVSGGTPDSRNPDFWDGDVPWATPTDITSLDSRFISSTTRCLTTTGLESCSATLVPAGSILVCTRATIGELAIADCPIATNQGFKSLILRSSYDPDFIYYLLLFNKRRLIQQSCGSTFLELSGRDFANLRFGVPILAEQQRIARILRTWDLGLAKVRGLQDAMLRERTLMMQMLFRSNKMHSDTAKVGSVK